MQSFTRASFYFVAHADDWQLFMAPEISLDIADKECKVIIIHTTAGDAGKGKKYWRPRERAAINSLLFRVSADSSIKSGKSRIRAGGKKISRFSANNCECYFMRLPDGAYDGSGFSRYAHQSIERLRSGIIKKITSVDRKAGYTSFGDLADTIDSIINLEIRLRSGDTIRDVCLHFPEDDLSLNPDDHNDHYNTAYLVQSTEAYARYRKRAYVGYQIRETAPLLTGEELFWKVGMFCCYHQSLYREYGHSTILEDPSFTTWSCRSSSARDI